MRLNIVFTTYLASRLPCHPLYLDWSREHVIPQSLMRSPGPRNIIPLPKPLNQARGNRPYTDDFKDGYVTYSCSNCPHPGYCAGSAIISPSGINPPNAFKGLVARSVIEMAFKYPHLMQDINDNVLNIDTAIKWDRMYPMTEQEKDWIRSLT